MKLLPSVPQRLGAVLALLVFAGPVAGQNVELVSVNSAGTAAGNAQTPTTFSSVRASFDGRFVVFDSFASDLVLGGTTLNRQHVYLRDRQAGTTTLISRNLGSGNEGDANSSNPFITPDGRFIVFGSFATNLVGAPDMTSESDVFRHDTCFGAPGPCTPSTIMIGMSNFADTSGDSFPAGVSDDGNFIAFVTFATLSGVTDTNNQLDVWVRDVEFGGLFAASFNAAGTAMGNGSSGTALISSNGGHVVFLSTATDLVATPVTATTNLYRRQIFFNTELVNVNAAGTGGGNGSVGNFSINSSGFRIAFDSSATDLVSTTDANGAGNDVFLRDLGFPNSTTLLSVRSDGTASGNNQSDHPSIDPGGSRIVFASLATNLVTGVTDTNSANDVFLRNVFNNTTTLISRNAAGAGTGNGASQSAATSGPRVVFASQATDLVNGVMDTNSANDVFLYTIASNTTTLASHNPAGTATGNGASEVSGNRSGALVPFASQATDLTALPDTNGASDAFAFVVPAPVINPGGVVNAASFASGQGLAAGSITAVFGTNLALITAIASAVPLPTTLGGATLTFNTSQSVPEFFAAPLQINAQVPWELSGLMQATLRAMQFDGPTSAGEVVPLVTFAPGLFATNQAGTGQGAILIANTPFLAAPMGAFPGSHPAMHGVDFLEIYWTGGGPVTNQPATGAAALANPLSATTTTPTLTIGGVDAPVLFSGLAPGFVGLYVATCLVPANAPTGDAVNVVLTIGGAQSNTVTIAVQ